MGSIAALPDVTPVHAVELARALKVSETLAHWLIARELADADAARRFLTPRLAELSSPTGMLDRAVAAERLARAVRNGERIAIFGDYDCDGITATAVLTELLRALGGEVAPLVARRFEGGYGVSAPAVQRILKTGAKLLVTCDCGSSDHASLRVLAAEGVEVIVIDHHLVPEEPLPALAFLNPHRPGCGFAFKGLASCGLALSVGAAVRAELGRTIDLKSVLDLVAIGTIADVAPLVDDNRALVRSGLALLSEARRPGVRAMFELARIERHQPLTAEDVAYRIAPRLNAPGRMGSPDLTLELLLERNETRADAIAGEVEQANLTRRAAQDAILAEALAEVEQHGYGTRPALVLGREGWGQGLVGIVAGRLADRFGCPVIIVGFERGHGRGSVRGPAGCRLHDALSAVGPLLERFGGHQAAAGLEMSIERLDELRTAFERAVEAQGPSVRATETAPAVSLRPGDTTSRVLADFAMLEPCGEGNPSPELELSALVLRAREVAGGHLKLELELDGGERVGAFGPGLGARAGVLSGRIVVRGRLRRDRYRGGDAAELLVVAIT
jgi:single-stranded-DNA-specific exonuclease